MLQNSLHAVMQKKKKIVQATPRHVTSHPELVPVVLRSERLFAHMKSDVTLGKDACY